MENIFVKTVLMDKVKVKPKLLNRNMKNLLSAILKTKYEGKCSHFGYIRPDSIQILKYSLGQVLSISLNGDVQYVVQFTALVCNPSINTIVEAKVVNTNKFGILAECYLQHNQQKVPILEIIAAKNNQDTSDVDLEKIRQGDTIHIQIMGKKFELNDLKISAIGKIVNQTASKLIKLSEENEESENDESDSDLNKEHIDKNDSDDDDDNDSDNDDDDDESDIDDNDEKDEEKDGEQDDDDEAKDDDEFNSDQDDSYERNDENDEDNDSENDVDDAESVES